MSEILIIPDLHGRRFWEEPCLNWDGTIVFLGDYHDPYGEYIDDEPNKHDSLINLRNLAEFVGSRALTHPCSTICLLGNHDLPYFTGNLQCRYDKINEEEVKFLMESLNLQVSYEVWDKTVEPTNKFLFSHAGVTLDWLIAHNLIMDSFLHITKKDNTILEEIPYSRGGYSKYGSCIWNSLEDYATEKHIPEYYQIFGHTWGGRTKPVINEEFAMLDCCKAFVLDTSTKEILPWTK